MEVTGVLGSLGGIGEIAKDLFGNDSPSDGPSDKKAKPTRKVTKSPWGDANNDGNNA